jgi:hypothetical protein
MKSVVVCGSKRYKAEVAKFCAALEKLGVLVFEPDFRPGIDEKDNLGNELVTQKIFKGLTLEHFDWVRKAGFCTLSQNRGSLS